MGVTHLTTHTKFMGGEFESNSQLMHLILREG